MRSLIRCVCVVVAISFAAGNCLAQDPSDSVVKVQTDYPECKFPGFCMPVRDYGSGVIVSGDGGRYSIVTNNHVVRGAISAREKARFTVHLRGKIYRATCIVSAPADDLAILEVLTADNLPVAELGDAASPGDAVVTMGYPEAGSLVQYRTQVNRRVRNGDLVLNCAVRSGHSGGGVFRGRELVGIQWGTSTNGTGSDAVTVTKVKHSMRCVGLRWREKQRSVVVTKTPVFQAPAPPPPPPAEPRNTWLPDSTNIELLKQLDLINKRLTAIELKPGVAGPQGPIGPAGASGSIGPQGPVGKDGVNGRDAKDIDVSGLVARLSALEARGIVVQLLDENGAVMSEQKYAPDAPIKLQFNPVKSETK